MQKREHSDAHDVLVLLVVNGYYVLSVQHGYQLKYSSTLAVSAISGGGNEYFVLVALFEYLDVPNVVVDMIAIAMKRLDSDLNLY